MTRWRLHVEIPNLTHSIIIYLSSKSLDVCSVNTQMNYLTKYVFFSQYFLLLNSFQAESPEGSGQFCINRKQNGSRIKKYTYITLVFAQPEFRHFKCLCTGVPHQYGLRQYKLYCYVVKFVLAGIGYVVPTSVNFAQYDFSQVP